MAKKIIQLIAAQPDWFAVYAVLNLTDGAAPKYIREPLACWGLFEDGDQNDSGPLVVNEKGYLEPAQDREGFLGINKPADAQHRTNWQEIASEYLENQGKASTKSLSKNTSSG